MLDKPQPTDALKHLVVGEDFRAENMVKLVKQKLDCVATFVRGAKRKIAAPSRRSDELAESRMPGNRRSSPHRGMTMNPGLGNQIADS